MARLVDYTVQVPHEPKKIGYAPKSSTIQPASGSGSNPLLTRRGEGSQARSAGVDLAETRAVGAKAIGAAKLGGALMPKSIQDYLGHGRDRGESGKSGNSPEKPTAITRLFPAKLGASRPLAIQASRRQDSSPSRRDLGGGSGVDARSRLGLSPKSIASKILAPIAAASVAAKAIGNQAARDESLIEPKRLGFNRSSRSAGGIGSTGGPTPISQTKPAGSTSEISLLIKELQKMTSASNTGNNVEAPYRPRSLSQPRYYRPFG